MAHKLSKSPWPLPADPAAAERLAERFAARSDAAAALAATADGSALLSAIGGGSPFLSDLAIREHAIVEDFAAQGPDATLARSMAALAAISPAAPRAQVAAAMRRAKRQVALVTALADIGGQWGLARVTGAISELAEAALRLAIAHLVLAAHHSGALTLPDPSNPEQGCGLVVLGMGKLGARELNYSSDIDLILLFDPDAHAQDSLGATFTRIARALVGMMEARDADGYVFRTDLRLRRNTAGCRPARSHHLLRDNGPELGACRDDEGATSCRRHCMRPCIPVRDPALRLAPEAGFRRHRRPPRHEAPHRCSYGLCAW
jgi:glutamate-ammonia-ligase adenylyltransferase